MARLEAYPEGIAYFRLDVEDVARIRTASEPLFRTFLNSRAVAVGQAQPLKITLTPSFSQGHPLTTLLDGSMALEVDWKLLGRKRSAFAIRDLTVQVLDDAIVIAEGSGSKREDAPEPVDADLEDRILDILRVQPLPTNVLRLMLPDAGTEVLTDALSSLATGGDLRLEGDAYIFQDKADTSDSGTDKPRKTLIAVKKLIADAEKHGIDVLTIVERTKFSREAVDRALNHLCETAQAFKYEDTYNIPDDEDRNGLKDMILEGLAEHPDRPTSLEVITKGCFEYHPAWVKRTLDTMHRKQQVDYDGKLYKFRCPERVQRSMGYNQVKKAIQAAGPDGVSIDDLFDRMAEFGLLRWQTRFNLGRLSDEGRIAVTDDVVLWQIDPAKRKAGGRMSFREEVRALLQKAGSAGMTRERIMASFPPEQSSRISIALNDLISRSEARRLSGVYTLRAKPKVELVLSDDRVA